MADRMPLASINQLFTDAWALTKSRFWSLLLLWLVQGLIIGLLVAVILAVLIGGSLGSLFSGSAEFAALTSETAVDASIVNSFLASFGPMIITVVVVLILASLIFGPMFQAANIAMAASEEKIGLGAALRKG